MAILSGAPRLVVTAGLHGSASTSLFNVVRELMTEAVGADNLVAVYGEDLSALPAPSGLERRHVVLKSHGGSPQWLWLAGLAEAPVVLSIRDPRDCVLSMVERFGNPPDTVVRGLAADCRLAVACADAGVTPLRYEDRFFEDESLAARLSAQLGLAVAPETCRQIGRRYTTAGVRRIAGDLSGLPPGRAVQDGKLHYDSLTQIHATHLGDGAIGKWRTRLSPEDGARLTRFFAPFLDRFGYSR